MALIGISYYAPFRFPFYIPVSSIYLSFFGLFGFWYRRWISLFRATCLFGVGIRESYYWYLFCSVWDGAKRVCWLGLYNRDSAHRILTLLSCMNAFVEATILAVHTASLHVLDKKTPADPVGVRMIPDEPQRNKMRDKVIIHRDFCPRPCLHLEERNVGKSFHIKDSAVRPFLKFLHLMDLFSRFLEFWWTFGVFELVFYIESDLVQRDITADQTAM